jgi:[acyl-carrier-protein] S-malonyltransferase
MHLYFRARALNFRAWVKITTTIASLQKNYLNNRMMFLVFVFQILCFNGTEEDLKQTNVTQPAVFLHSIVAYRTIESASPDMVAGHSLGEFSALVANGTLSFEDALQLVAVRARAMQKACEMNPSTMAAVLNLAMKK